MYSDDNGQKFVLGTTSGWTLEHLWWHKVDPYIRQRQTNNGGPASMKGVYLCPSAPKLPPHLGNLARCYGYNAFYLGMPPGTDGKVPDPSTGGRVKVLPLSACDNPSATALLMEIWRYDATAKLMRARGDTARRFATLRRCSRVMGISMRCRTTAGRRGVTRSRPWP